MDKHAECPYYRYEKEGRIYCEAGRIEAKSVLMRRELAYGYCAGNWAECTLKKMLDNYYERQEKLLERKKENH